MNEGAPISDPNENELPTVESVLNAKPTGHTQETNPKDIEIKQDVFKHRTIDEVERERLLDERHRILAKVSECLHSFIAKYESGEHTTLKKRQLETLYKIADFVDSGNNMGFVKFPTGVGKTVIFSEFIEALRDSGLRVMVGGPTKIILHQNALKIETFSGAETGKYYGKEKDTESDVVTTTYSSMRRLNNHSNNPLNEFDVFILDEAHKTLGEQTSEMVENLGASKLMIGFTATPVFHAEKSVADVLDYEIDTLDQKTAIEEGLSAPCRVWLVNTKSDISKVKISADGDYNEGELRNAVDTLERNKTVVDTYLLPKFKGRKAIATAVDRIHAKNLVAEFQKAGIKAEYFGGDLPDLAREGVLTRFKYTEEDHVEVLVGIDMIAEGLDEDKVEVSLNVRPTFSKVFAEQRSGRALRLNPKDDRKVADVIDFVDDIADSTTPPVLYSEILGAAEVFPKDKKKSYYEKRDEESSDSYEVKDNSNEKISTSDTDSKSADAESIGDGNKEDKDKMPDSIVKPKNVMKVTLKNKLQRHEYVHAFAPPRWAHARMIAHDAVVPVREIKLFADQFRIEHPEWFKQYLTPLGYLTEHYSSELCHKIRGNYISGIRNTKTIESYADEVKMPTQGVADLISEIEKEDGEGAVMRFGEDIYFDNQFEERIQEQLKKFAKKKDQVDRVADAIFWKSMDSESDPAAAEDTYYETTDKEPSIELDADYERPIFGRDGSEMGPNEVEHFGDRAKYKHEVLDEEKHVNIGELQQKIAFEEFVQAHKLFIFGILNTGMDNTGREILSELERETVKRRFFNNATYSRIVSELGTSVENVRQAELRAFRKIKEAVRVRDKLYVTKKSYMLERIRNQEKIIPRLRTQLGRERKELSLLVQSGSKYEEQKNRVYSIQKQLELIERQIEKLNQEMREF